MESSAYMLVEIKSKVELVAVAALGRRLAVLATEADAELDDLQQVHVALQRLVREAVRGSGRRRASPRRRGTPCPWRRRDTARRARG